MAVAELQAPPQRPELSPEQRQLLLAASAELLCATVTERPAAYTDPSLAGAAQHMVSGAFFSLKRGKHLRGCCGGLRDQPLTLSEAVADAIVRTALEDVRFPIVSPTELEHLDMEIWLLFNQQRVQAHGAERERQVVTGGKHGLVIARGESRGLLLPGVAVEHDWDVRHFLEQACVKAGLHASMWKDDATAVFTFEGVSLRGRVADFEASHSVTPPPPLLTNQELETYARFCARNIRAFLTGAVPLYSVDGVPDGTVNGVLLAVRRQDHPNTANVSQISLRPGVALQATLFQLAQSAAQQLVAKGMTAGLDTARLGLSLAVLTDPAVHGSAAEPSIQGFDPKRRALLVMERNKSGLAFDPNLNVDELLASAVRLGKVNTPGTAALFSFDAMSTEPNILMSSAPQPMQGPDIRPAAVAGTFYPAEADGLSQLVDELLGDERGSESWPAAMVPHAGMRYSGQIAAAVLRRLKLPRTVIVLGPKHTPSGMDWAVAPHQSWALPGGSMAADPELARELAAEIDGLSLDALAHHQEHAIEVELPLLHRLAPETRVVGIAIAHGNLESCQRFADGLANVLRRREEPALLLISSDMNHFATDAETRVLDDMALAALEKLDAAQVYETVTQNHISMCGVLPAVIVLETLKRLGKLTKAERVRYATTADVTGDTSRVVGYAGMLFG